MTVYKKELKPVTYSDAGVTVLHFSIPANQMCFRMHWHERMELIRLNSGELLISYGGEPIKMRAGDLAIFPPKTPHGGFAGEESVNYDVLMFDIRSFYHDSEVSKKYLTALFNGCARFERLTSDMETVRCFDTICLKEGQGTLEITAYIYKLLFLLFEHSLIELRNGLGRDDVVKNIVKYIEENYQKEITTASISGCFGYTEAHFCRKFKDTTGLTPMNYLKIIRMEEAYKMLKNGECSISEVAMSCGFSDPNYFTRCFKGHFGMTPSKTCLEIHENREKIS